LNLISEFWKQTTVGVCHVIKMKICLFTEGYAHAILQHS